MSIHPVASERSGFQLPLPFAAPHRLLFLGGVVTVLSAMGWWTAELALARFGGTMPQPSIPPGWAHAMLLQYAMLPLFIFGFLMTVFPRWLDRPALRVRHFAPVFALQFGGGCLVLAGVFGLPDLLRTGFVLMLAAACLLVAVLGNVWWRSTVRDAHARSCLLALCMGAFGLAAFTAYLDGASAWWALVAIHVGTFAYLLPIYLTVCHRMLPFFSSRVIPGYRMWRPRWSLPVFWLLLMAHLGLGIAHRFAWRWPVDGTMAVLLAWHALAWQPWKAMRPGLLAVLHVAFAWAPFAFALYALQEATLALTGELVLGRAPLHALSIGFFGSMLVAMVTRVTQGHSGRPLQMGAAAWFGFIVMQVVVVLRMAAALDGSARATWLLLAACGWMLAFAPWAVRMARIYLTPRVDGRGG